MDKGYEEYWNGIRGWLLFFILTRVAFAPIWNAWRTTSKWDNLAVEVGVYSQTTEFQSLATLAWLEYGIATAINIAMGVLLVLVRRPASVYLAIAGLALIGFVLPFTMYFAGLNLTGQSFLFEDLRFLAAPATSAIIWILYLTRSDRVAVTYGMPE